MYYPHYGCGRQLSKPRERLLAGGHMFLSLGGVPKISLVNCELC